MKYPTTGDYPTDWSQDRFGRPMEGTPRYGELRGSDKFAPVENETLIGYVLRMEKMIKNQEEVNTTAHIYGRKTWFTHRTPSECWICEDVNAMWQLYTSFALLADITSEKAYFHYDIQHNNKLEIIIPS